MSETVTYRELRRSRSDRMIAGVCGGLGRYFNVNPAFYRVGFVVLTFLGGAGILIYGACVLVIPGEGERDSIASDILRNHRQRPVALVGLALASVAGIVLLSHISIRFHNDVFWALVLAVGALLLWAQRRAPAPAGPPEPPAERPAAPAATPPARRRGFLAMTAFAIGVLALAAAVAVVVVATIFARLDHGVGNREYAPVTASAIRPDYQVGVGRLRLDLSRAALPAGTTRIHVEAGIGQVRIIVPRDVTVHATTHVSWGYATLLGHEEAGHNVRADVGAENGRLELDTRVGIGEVEVERSVR